MPPKAKFTRNEIVEAALEIVREQGMEGITARELGRRLGSSACPVFTVFRNMEEVTGEVLRAAKDLYRSYVDRGLSEEMAFRGVGMAYIEFARREPRLFQLLFMQEQQPAADVGHTLMAIDESYERILASVQVPYGLNREDARRMYQHLWIYTHGIAAMCATGVCSFTTEEIGAMMKEVFTGLLKEVKGSGENGKSRQSEGYKGEEQ